jgi:hypothetical protein
LNRLPLIALVILTLCSCSVQDSGRKDPFAQYAQGKTTSNSQNRSALKSPGNNFRVSVSSDGQPVTDFTQKLVHRITLSKSDLKRLAQSSNSQSVPFKGNLERDQQGKIAGLRITEIRTPEVLPTLGLEDGDLLTAIGKKQPRSLSDLAQLALELASLTAKDKTSSITVVRRGRPHKIIYSLN